MLGDAQLAEQLIFHRVDVVASGSMTGFAVWGELYGASAAVGGVRLACDQPFVLELVEQADEAGLVIADRFGRGCPDRGLCPPRASRQCADASDAAVCFAAVLGWERRGLLPWGSALGAVYFMSQFLQSDLGYGPLSAGLRLMPWGAATVIVPQVVGRLIGRFGERLFVVGGMSLHAGCMVWIAAVADAHVAYLQLVVPLVLSGAGVAMSVPAAQSAVLGSVQAPDMGRASGAFATFRQLGGAFGVAVLVAVFASSGGYGSPQVFNDGFVAAIAACAGLAVIAALAGVALSGRRPTPAPPTAQHDGLVAAPPVEPHPARAGRYAQRVS